MTVIKSGNRKCGHVRDRQKKGPGGGEAGNDEGGGGQGSCLVNIRTYIYMLYR